LKVAELEDFEYTPKEPRIFPYSCIVHNPDPDVEYYEAYKNVGRRYVKIASETVLATAVQAAIDSITTGTIICKGLSEPAGLTYKANVHVIFQGSDELYSTGRVPAKRGAYHVDSPITVSVTNETDASEKAYKFFNLGADPDHVLFKYTLNNPAGVGWVIGVDLGAPTLVLDAGTHLYYTALNILGPVNPVSAQSDIYGIVVDMANKRDHAINVERGETSLNTDGGDVNLAMGINPVAFTGNHVFVNQSMSNLTGTLLGAFNLTYNVGSIPALTVDAQSPTIRYIDLTNFGVTHKQLSSGRSHYRLIDMVLPSMDAASVANGIEATGIRIVGGALGIQTGIYISMNAITDIALDIEGGVINFASAITSTTATAGSRTLPANPDGFIIINVVGSIRKIPYYNN